MTHSSVIRPAASGDIPALGRLGAMLVAAHHAFDRARFFAATEDTATGYGEFLGTRIGKRGQVLLVAEADGAAVGYAWGALEGTDFQALRGPAALLYDLIVDPAQRGRGIGEALLRAALKAFEARGAPRTVLFAAAANRAAQRLFARHGFRDTMVEMTRERGAGES